MSFLLQALHNLTLYPDAVAVVEHGRAVSYRDLDINSRKLAARLIHEGVRPGDWVGVAMPSSEAIAAILGILRTGAGYVPLDPEAPRERLAAILAAARPTCVVAPGLGAFGGEAQSLAVVDDGGLPAYLLFTSGSAGEPKGVVMRRGPLSQLIQWQIERPGFAPRSRTLRFAPLSFDVSFQEIFSTLASGGTLVIPAQDQRRDLLELARLVADQAVERIFVPYAILNGLSESLCGLEQGPLALRECITAGEQLLITEPIRNLFTRNPHLRLYNQYGPTETHVVTELALDSDPRQWGVRPSIGSSLPHVLISLRDASGREVVECGDPGEIWVFEREPGHGIAQGYLSHPRGADPDDAARFGSEAFRGRMRRCYRTGDWGRRLANGQIEYLGRIDRQIKVRGVRIELGEIEAALTELPHITQAAVTSDLRAYLTANVSLERALSGMRDALKQRLLPEMMPVDFYQAPALPLSANGKVDYRALDRLPGCRLLVPDEPVDETLDDMERAIAGIWAECLPGETASHRIGRNSQFIDAGGDSLSALRAIVLIRDRLGMNATVGELLNCATLRDFATRLRRYDRPVPWSSGDGPFTFSLSQAQMQIAWIEEISGPTPALTASSTCRWEGALTEARVRESLSELLRLHPALSTAITIGDQGQLLQTLGQPENDVPLEWQPLDPALDPPAWAASCARTPFSLKNDRFLWRFFVLETGRSSYELAVAFHHILVDGESVGIFWRDLRSLLTGEAVEAGSDAYHQHLAWERALPVAPPRDVGLALELPYDAARQPDLVGFSRGARLQFALPPELAARVFTRAAAHRLSPFQLLLSAFAALISGLSGQDAVSVTTMISTRALSPRGGALGLCLESAAVPFEVDWHAGIPDFLRRCARTISDVLQEPWHYRARSGEARVLFVMQEHWHRSHAGADLWSGEAQADLACLVTPAAATFTMTLEYRACLFTEETIARIRDAWLSLLTSLCDPSCTRLAELDLVGPRREEWLALATGPVRPLEQGVCERLAQIARRAPDRVAIESGRSVLTYLDLDRASTRIAHALRHRGLPSGARVGLQFQRGAEYVVALWAVLKAGACFVPLDPTDPDERRRYIVEDSRIDLLLTETELERLSSRATDAPGGLPRLDLDAPAYMIYTSGSTGRPKGAVLSHRGLANMARAAIECFGIDDTDRILQFASKGFDASVFEIVSTLLAAATLVMEPRDALFGGEGVEANLTRLRITALLLTPSMWSVLDPSRLPRLRKGLTAGEACSREIVQRWSRRLRFVNAYGPTECSVMATCSAPQWDAGSTLSTPSIGTPIANTQTYVLNPALMPVPIGGTGEIFIGGDSVGIGYFDEPELTREAFVPSPWAPLNGQRLYRTGDRGRMLPSGEVLFLGRRDNQVKVRGVRIELGEIESVLLSDPRITLGVVVHDPECQELVAFFQAGDGAVVSGAELRSLVRRQLIDAMVPAHWVEVDEWPRTSSDKIDRARLLAGFRSARRAHERAAEPAITTGEETSIYNIFADCLNVSGFEPDAHFTDLGGTSLAAARALGHINRRFEIGLTLGEFFELGSVRALAQRLTGHGGAPRMTVSPESETDLRGLPPLARATPPRRKAFARPGRVLLTGATGFLGRHLLEKLLDRGMEPCCLVRSPGSVRARSDASCAVRVIQGDLGAPRFGLSGRAFDRLAQTTEAILHAGASTNFVDSFVSLKPPNVLGTKTAIELSLEGGGIPLHHVSTLALLDGSDRASARPPVRARFENLRGAYLQSKWIAEEMIERASLLGVPVTIYRPGNIAADRRTGCCNQRDVLCHLFRTSLLLGCVPAMTFALDWAPVDLVSEAIAARIAGGQGPAIEHLCHPTGISAAHLVELACEEWGIAIVDEAEWLHRVTDLGPRAPIFPLVGFIREAGGLAAVLERTGDRGLYTAVNWEIGDDALRAYLRRLSFGGVAPKE